MFSWLWRGFGHSRGTTGGVLGGVDEIFHPGAWRAKELLERQHSLVMPMPSPGDKLLNDGVLVIDAPRGHTGSPGTADG